MQETDIRSCQIINRWIYFAAYKCYGKIIFLDYDIEQMMVHEKYCSLQYDEDRCRLKGSLKSFKNSAQNCLFQAKIKNYDFEA